MIRVHMFIRGRVQGVFFRQHMAEKAAQLGLTGWVRNLPDGRTVEAVVEGPEDKVRQLVEWAHRGPPLAEVESVEVHREEYRGEYRDFRILPTPRG